MIQRHPPAPPVNVPPESLALISLWAPAGAGGPGTAEALATTPLLALGRTFRFLEEQYRALQMLAPYGPHDVAFSILPLVSLGHLAVGVDTVVPAFNTGSPSEQGALILIAQLRSCRVTCLNLTLPWLETLSKLCQTKGLQLTELKRILVLGRPPAGGDLARIHAVAPQAEIRHISTTSDGASSGFSNGLGDGFGTGFGDGLEELLQTKRPQPQAT